MPDYNYRDPRAVYKTNTQFGAYTFADFVEDLKQMFTGFGTGLKVSTQVVPLATTLLGFQKQTLTSSDFVSLYSKCTRLVVADVKEGILCYLDSRRKPIPYETVEDVLRRYMGYSTEVNNPAILINDALASSVASKVLDLLAKLFKSAGSLKEYTPDVPLKPYFLAVLWGVMLTELSFHVMSSTTDDEIERIARLGVAITLGAITGVTGYFHSGGSVAGFRSPTSAIKTYYTTQRAIKDYTPSLYSKIPSFLKFPTAQRFEDLLTSEKITAGMGMNMAYTFRIGDAFLLSMQGRGAASDEALKNVLKSIWPLVTSSEAEKMYRLYTTEDSIYSI